MIHVFMEELASNKDLLEAMIMMFYVFKWSRCLLSLKGNRKSQKIMSLYIFETVKRFLFKTALFFNFSFDI